MGLDKRGKFRGQCQQCSDCEEYEQPCLGHDCEYCGCKPPKHKLELLEAVPESEAETAGSSSAKQARVEKGTSSESEDDDNNPSTSDEVLHSSVGNEQEDEEISKSEDSTLQDDEPHGDLHLKNLQKRANTISAAENENDTNGPSKYNITFENGVYYFNCIICDTKNKVRSDSESTKEITHHGKTAFHLFKLNSLKSDGAGLKMAQKVFQDVEAAVGEGVFAFKPSGFAHCRPCNLDIALFGRGNDVTRAQDHVSSSNHCKANKAGVHKMRNIADFMRAISSSS